VPSDQDIEGLYQLPLAEFTPARNALAKESGKAGIRHLEKPSVPAWAVNQLYWRERKAYDKLVRASERVRAGHAQRMKGRKIDLPLLEQQHGAAVKDASARVRDILARAGDAATPATMKAVIDTLQALPGGEPGRLTRALAPIGFDAFGALLKGAVTAKSLAEVVEFAPRKPKPDEVAEAARRAGEASARRLRELDAQIKKIAAAVRAARTKLTQAERRRAVVQTQLEDASQDAARHRSEVARLERDARAASQERARLKSELN
jgi:hypothetical protein